VVLAGTKSVALCHVQELLGARDSETTEAYTHAPLVYTIRRPHLRESERSRRMLPNRY
jgi:site-specific recombinase XerD